jgi:protein-S-isoprenylcysteine O-methyltransferase Ste14
MLFWLWSARGAKRTERRESWASRLSYILLSMLGLAIMTLAGPRIFPASEATNFLAVALTWAGLLFSIWARAILGRNWSGTVTLKENHELISTGPYRFVRNPIYTGMLLAGMGGAIAIDTLPAGVGYAIVFAALVRKSVIEQRMLTAHFGAAYNEYRSRTKLLVPYLF